MSVSIIQQSTRPGEILFASSNSKKKKAKVNKKGGILQIMVPGTETNPETGKVLVNFETSKKTVKFNIGGEKFEVYQSTLYRVPNNKLSNDKFLKQFHRPEKDEYFLDRDPAMFKVQQNIICVLKSSVPQSLEGKVEEVARINSDLMSQIIKMMMTNKNDDTETMLSTFIRSGSSGELKVQNVFKEKHKKNPKQSVLRAMMPGAEIKKDGKFFLNVGTSKEVIRFNVGGLILETYRSTLYRIPRNPLADDKFLKKHYRKQYEDYFIDRDPEIFKSILNYLRTGELHIPSYVCGPAAKSELEFWGVSDDVIERCCWTNYNSWNSTQQALNQLERDRKVSFYHSEDPAKVTGYWKKLQAQAWEILNRPNSSRLAKIYGWVSLFFVTISIFAFIAETHPTFGYYKTILDTSNKSVSNSTAENVTETPIYRQVPVTHPVLHIIDICCVCFFALEYLSRIIFAHQRFKYIRSLMGVIDFLALVPDCVQFIAYAIKPELEYDGTVESLAILRIARVLRVFRLIRHVPGLWILIYTLKASLKELLLMTVFLIVGMLFFSSLMYYAEDREDFQSIPHGFWWALITMTTVGYGDMYPKTAWGYLIGSFTALMGLLMIGFSVPVLVSNFIMYYKHVEFALNQERLEKEKNDQRKEEIPDQEQPLINQNKNNFFVNNNSTQETVLLSDMDKEPSSPDT